MREVIYHCAGPGCSTFIQSAADAPPRGWLTVREREDETVTETDYCGWSCLLQVAGRIDPEEIIPANL